MTAKPAGARRTGRSGALRTLQHRLEYVLLAAGVLALSAVPRRLALGIGAGLGQLGWWTRARRRLVLANLERALPDVSAQERRRIGASAARSFGRTMAEFLRFPFADRKRVLDLIQIEGLHHVHEALSAGKGAALVTGHLGSWALYVTALGAAGVPSALLVGVQRNPWVDRFINTMPGDAMQLIAKAKGSPREILLALRANKAIVMVADHYSSDQKVYVPFLGHPAFTLPLPGSLVARHRVPLLCMTGHRQRDGRHQLEIRPLEVPELPSLDAVRLEVAVRCNRALGAAVLAHPDQYFWYHDRWKVRQRKQPPRLEASPLAEYGETKPEST